MEKAEKLIKLLSEARESAKHFFINLFQGDIEMQEYSDILKNEKNLYNPDGTRTEEFDALLEKIEIKLDSCDIDARLISSASSPEEADAIQSILGFVEDRESLIEDYRTSITEYDGNTDSWVKDRITKGLEGEEKELKIKKVDDILSSEDDIVD